jgi:hypothetical protein
VRGGERTWPQRRGGGVEALALEDTVAQLSAAVPLGAFYLNKRINTKVWMSVDWNRTDGIDQSIKTNSKFSQNKSRRNLLDYNSGLSFRTSLAGSSSDLFQSTISLDNKESPSQPSVAYTEIVDFLSRKPLIENVTLKLYPMYYDEMTVQPKVKICCLQAIEVLLVVLICLL